MGICDSPVDQRDKVALESVLCRAGISPASAPDLRREFSPLTPVLVLHGSQRTSLTRVSSGIKRYNTAIFPSRFGSTLSMLALNNKPLVCAIFLRFYKL